MKWMGGEKCGKLWAVQVLLQNKWSDGGRDPQLHLKSSSMALWLFSLFWPFCSPDSYPAPTSAQFLPPIMLCLGLRIPKKLPVTLLRCFAEIAGYLESCSAQTSRFPRDWVGCLSANVLQSHCQILAFDLPERCPDFASLSYRVCL